MNALDCSSWRKQVDEASTEGTFQAWEVFQRGILLYHRQTTSGTVIAGADLQCINQTAQKVLCEDFLRRLWQAVADHPNQPPDLVVVHQAALRQYRLLSNILLDDSSWMSYEAFLKALLSSLFACVPSFLRSGQQVRLKDLFGALDASQGKRWMLLMMHDEPVCQQMLDLLDLPQVLRGWSLWVRAVRGAAVITAQHHALVRQVMQRLMKESIDPLELIEKVLLLDAVLLHFLDDLLAGTSSGEQTALLQYLAAILGDQTFIASADLSRQSLLVAYMLRILSVCDQQAMAQLDPRGMPTEVTLTICISNLFDSSDYTTRINGMKVARAYSRIMGQEMVFEELTLFEAQQPAPSSSSIAHAPATAADAKDVAEDSDSDIEGFALGDEPRYGAEGLKAPELNTRFLRTCLELLQTSDSAAGARLRHQAGLERIPEIMKTHPADSKDLAVPLVVQLINQPNAFNIEHFDELRDHAALSVITAEPSLCAPAVTAALFNTEVGIGLKRTCILWLRKAAMALSHTSTADDANSLLRIAPAEPMELIGKSKVKKPETLRVRQAEQMSRTKYVNKFNDVSADFFFPMVRMLLGVLQPAQRQDEKKSEYNRIQELFGDETKPTNSSSSSSGYKEKAAKLSGIDAILPTEGLIALANFIQCCYYSPHIKKYTQMTMDVARLFRDCPEVTLRRASLCAIYTSIDCSMKHSAALVSGGGPVQRKGVMDSLLHISDDNALADETSALGDAKSSLTQDLITSSAGVDTLDWLVSTFTTDADATSRDLKAAILGLCKKAIEP